MDDLLHFVRHEVAMDGDDGTPIDRLDTFLETFYARAADSKDTTKSSNTSSISTQNIDNSFKDFVWKQLASLPELKVAFLRKLGNDHAAQGGTPDPGAANADTPAGENNEAGQASTPVPAPIASTSTALLDDEGNPIDQGAFNLKNKAKIKAARQNDQSRHRDARLTGDQYEFVEIPQEEIQTSTREQLLEKYGNTLRIAADPETCYVALTGSHERFGKLTPLAYQVLQAIARGREDGKTVVDLGKEFAHDQKSLFHFVKSLCELNLIIKMKVLDARSQTSRCIHRHYLETSRHWATWMTKDPNENTAKGEDDEDDMGKSAPLTIMTVAHINSNEPFVRSRIINALKNAPENMIPHLDLVFAIGFHARPDREHRRRINRIVTSMEKQGLVEKVGVARQGARGLLSCLKLHQSPPLEGQDSTDGQEAIPSEEDEVEQRPNILTTLPVERQVVDLLASAGHQGLTIRELQASLGDVGIRSLETLLTRIEKNAEPPHLCDYAIQSVFETYGREKRLRYFTIAGYHERCRQDGLNELVNQSDFSFPELAGGFSYIDFSEFYSTPQEFAKIAERMVTSSNGKVRANTKPKGRPPRPRDPNQPVKKGRPKGSTKAAKQAASTAANGEPSAPQDDNAATDEKPKKKRKAKNAEADPQGDAPPAPKKKGRSKKDKPAEGEPDQPPPVNGTSVSDSVVPTADEASAAPASKAKKPAKSRKSKATSEAASSVPSEILQATTSETDQPTLEDSNMDTSSIPAAPSATVDSPSLRAGTPVATPTQSKKRGRPPKNDEETPGEDGVKGKGKKNKAELDENGNPIKGRPRKYPPGTTSAQRKVLLEQRRAAGLEPPSKKKKENNKEADTPSDHPSTSAPAGEPVVRPAGATDVSAEAPAAMAIDNSEGPSEPVAIFSAAAGVPSQSLESTALSMSDKGRLTQGQSTLEEGDATKDVPVPSIVDTSPVLEAAQPITNPPIAATLPGSPALSGVIRDAGTNPERAQAAESASEAIATAAPILHAEAGQTEPPSKPTAAKKRGRQRSSVLPVSAPASEAQVSQQDSTTTSVPAEGVVVLEDASEPGIRRSKRQKTGQAGAPVSPNRPRRGRSSNIKADTAVKIEDLPPASLDDQEAVVRPVSELNETQTKQEVMPETGSTPRQQIVDALMTTDEAAEAVARETANIENPESAALVADIDHDADASENPRGPSLSGARVQQATIPGPTEYNETAPSIAQASSRVANYLPAEAPTVVSKADLISSATSRVNQDPAREDGSVAPTEDDEAAYAEKNLEPYSDKSRVIDGPIQLPPMPEPLRTDEGNLGTSVEQGPIDIVPNVVAKPVEMDLKQTKGPERRNHSMQVHENEYIATLKEAGGIVEDGIPLNKLWQEYMQRKDPSKGVPRPLDRRTTKIVSTSLEKRGLIKRSILQFQGGDGKMVQRPIMYLASIALNGPEMREFALGMQEKMTDVIAAPKNWLLGRKTIDKTAEVALAPRRGRRQVGEVPTEARPFFLKNWRIVAQFFGWQYGFLARAKTLHEYLVSSITDENDSAFIISSNPNIRIFSAPFVLHDTPLSVFLRIAAVSEYSEELERFLQQDGALEMPIKQLPPELSGLFGAHKARGYSRFSQLFATLMVLKLLVPLEQVDHESPIVAYSGIEREPRYFSAREDRSGATYWLLPSQAPVYDMQERKASDQRLLGQLPIITPQEAANYWDTVQGLTFGTCDASNLPPATVKYPATMNAPASFIFSARSSWHWRSSYLLLAQQKTYLRRVLDEAPSKDILLSDGEKLKQIAYNICAPVQAVTAYYAKPRQGARPEWAKKRKRQASRKQILDDSGTSASEPEGPVAPLSRSRRAEKAKAKALKLEKVQEDAVRLKKQQEVIAMKARGAAQAKQAVWDGIVNGFRLQHGEEALKMVQLDFLHTWFLSPEGPTALTIQKHLEQAVEGAQSAPIVIPSRSALTSKTGSIANRAQGKKMNRKLTLKAATDGSVAAPAKDFALYDLPELPEVRPSGEKKTANAGWTPEEDEQLLDLYVILQSRANDRDTKLSMEPAVALFPGTKPKLLVERLRRIASKPGEVAYLDALQAAWSDLWHKEQITDPLLHDAIRNASPEGLLLLRRVLNGLLNKQSLRFQAIMPADAAAAAQTRLPADPEDLKQAYLLQPKSTLESLEDSRTYSYLWSTITTAQKSIKFNYQPFCTSYNETTSPVCMSSSERLDCFKTRYERLDKVSPDCVKDANAFTKRLLDEGEVEWAPICEDGDMLAVAHLFSDDLLKFSIDTSVTRSGRPYTDYRTRKTDDDNFENTLTIQPKEGFTEQCLPLFAIPSATAQTEEPKDQGFHETSDARYQTLVEVSV